VGLTDSTAEGVSSLEVCDTTALTAAPALAEKFAAALADDTFSWDDENWFLAVVWIAIAPRKRKISGPLPVVFLGNSASVHPMAGVACVGKLAELIFYRLRRKGLLRSA
jgi:hypothetical protein